MRKWSKLEGEPPRVSESKSRKLSEIPSLAQVLRFLFSRNCFCSHVEVVVVSLGILFDFEGEFWSQTADRHARTKGELVFYGASTSGAISAIMVLKNKITRCI